MNGLFADKRFRKFRSSSLRSNRKVYTCPATAPWCSAVTRHENHYRGRNLTEVGLRLLDSSHRIADSLSTASLNWAILSSGEESAKGWSIVQTSCDLCAMAKPWSTKHRETLNAPSIRAVVSGDFSLSCKRRLSTRSASRSTVRAAITADSTLLSASLLPCRGGAEVFEGAPGGGFVGAEGMGFGCDGVGAGCDDVGVGETCPSFFEQPPPIPLN